MDSSFHVFGVSVPYFPPPLVLALVFVSPSPPFPMWPFQPVVRLGPFFPLPARMGLSVISLVLGVVP